VVLDWRYIEARGPNELAAEGRWAFRQRLSVVVDFTSGMNLYPDLRLLQNSADDYARSMARIEAVLGKMATLVNATAASQPTAAYSRHAILSLHRGPSNYYSEAQTQRDFVTCL
jgi:hypothetical protein